jgi:hypothetical protein
MTDKRVIACNYTVGTSSVPTGSKAYVVYPNLSNVAERVCVYVRSRSGRWIEKWENLDRLDGFRLKTVPPESPQYDGCRTHNYDDRTVEALRACKTHRSTKRKAGG